MHGKIYNSLHTPPHVTKGHVFKRKKREKDFKGVTKTSEINWMSDLKKGKMKGCGEGHFYKAHCTG
jgi:hypothetical protein